MSESILFIDDDRMVLNALERAFFECEYQTFFTASTDEALKILESEKIDMVVSDIRMSPVSGYEFLKEVRAHHPDIIRVVLSAYGDRNTMVKVICEGVAKIYILKPWDNKFLLERIGRLFELYKSLEKIRKAGIIVPENHLPPLPKLYIQMVQMIEEERSLKEIAALIETDPSCSADILKLVNSSFYGVTVGSVHNALVYLGVDCIKDIVLVSELFRQGNNIHNSDLRMQLNRHMIVSSSLFHGLYQHLEGKRIPEDFSSAGLLADIGRFLILDGNSVNYRTVMDRYIKDPAGDLLQTEEEIVGYSHSQIGALLLDWWSLPAYLVEACMYHHVVPFETRTLPRHVIALIHTADFYAWQKVEGKCSAGICREAVDLFGITENELNDIVVSILNREDFASK